MTAIWHEENGKWHALAPQDFANEAALHNLIENAPGLLPLSGTPELVVLGREVNLGGNLADLIAVEPSGRLAVIEIKLQKNAEARRAIVAQVLTYAAVLHGMPLTEFRAVIAKHVGGAGVERVEDLVAAANQTGDFEAGEFIDGLEESLGSGHFRLVLVLDDAPSELVRLCGYLEAVTHDRLQVDLIAVSAYEINGSRVMVPQRIDPGAEHSDQLGATSPKSSPKPPPETWGTETFEAAVDDAASPLQESLKELVAWAKGLESEGVTRLKNKRGTGAATLRPLAGSTNSGLITITDSEQQLWFWRSVWESHAPDKLAALETHLGKTIGFGTGGKADPELLNLIAEAYRAAAKR